jgi:hypothetical protein
MNGWVDKNYRNLMIYMMFLELLLLGLLVILECVGMSRHVTPRMEESRSALPCGG